MTFALLKRYVRTSPTLRRVVEIVDFCTYREVREFDFGRAELPRSARES